MEKHKANSSQFALKIVFLVILVVVASFIILSAIYEVSYYSDLIPMPLGQGSHSIGTIGLRTADINLKANSFNPVSMELNGNISVSLHPRWISNPDENLKKELEKESKEILSISDIVVWFSHYEHNKDGRGTFVRQGGTTKTITLKPNPLSPEMVGEGTFIWKANAIVTSFWYPFDKYSLNVNPVIVRPETIEYKGLLEFIDTINLELQVPSMRLKLEKRIMPTSESYDPEDTYTLTLDRPLPLQLICIVLMILSIFWLGYLILGADTENYIGGILTLFVGIWGIRGTLMGNLYIFPCLLDYVTITLAINAVLIVLFKWLSHKVAHDTRRCPHCFSRILVQAQRCPYCTSSVNCS